MVKGAFKSMRHKHLFYTINNQTVMKDIFIFESPCRILGDWLIFFFSGGIWKSFKKRNKVIKEAAESNR